MFSCCCIIIVPSSVILLICNSTAMATLEEALSAAHAIDDHVTAMVAMAHLSLIWYPLARLRLLAERAVELDIVESISHETVRRCLKKTS